METSGATAGPQVGYDMTDQAGVSTSHGLDDSSTAAASYGESSAAHGTQTTPPAWPGACGSLLAHSTFPWGYPMWLGLILILCGWSTPYAAPLAAGTSNVGTTIVDGNIC